MAQRKKNIRSRMVCSAAVGKYFVIIDINIIEIHIIIYIYENISNN